MALSILTAVELFQGTSDEEARKITGLCADRKYRKGTEIFSRGDPADSLYIVKEGRVRLVALSEKGTETILHILKPGAIFGELFLSEEKRAFTAVAGTDVLVTYLSRGSFVGLLVSIPTVSGNFLRLLSKRLAKVEKEFAGFGHTWSYHRLAKILLELGEEHGVKTPKGTLLPLRLTHEDLANLIGTTRETVTTQLNRFRHMGLIGKEGRRILLNIPRLAGFLRNDRSPSRRA